MARRPENVGSGTTIQTIVAGVAVALLAGGTSPWWWSKLFPEKPTAVVHPHMGPLEGGTNRHGGDLFTVGIQSNSAAECSDLCATDENCRAMTFVKHADANGGICWPKGSASSQSTNQAMVSAVKVYPRP